MRFVTALIVLAFVSVAFTASADHYQRDQDYRNRRDAYERDQINRYEAARQDEINRCEAARQDEINRCEAARQDEYNRREAYERDQINRGYQGREQYVRVCRPPVIVVRDCEPVFIRDYEPTFGLSIGRGGFGVHINTDSVRVRIESSNRRRYR